MTDKDCKEGYKTYRCHYVKEYMTFVCTLNPKGKNEFSINVCKSNSVKDIDILKDVIKRDLNVIEQL